MTTKTPLTDKDLQRLIVSGGPKGKAMGYVGGFTFSLSDKGTATFIYRFTSPLDGRKKELHIGRYPEECDIERALKLVLEAKELIRAGKDPAIEKNRNKQRKSSVYTLADLTQSYMEWKFQDLSENSIRAQKVSIENDILPYLGKFPAREINREDIDNRLEAIGKRAPSMAKRARTVIEAIFGHGIALRIIEDKNQWPTGKHLMNLIGKKPKEKDKRVLSEEELRFLLSTIGDSSNADVLRILLGTGVRINELIKAQWEDIDMDTAFWFIPACRKKERRVYICPVSPYVLEAFQRLKVRANGSPWVLPSRRRHASKGHMSDATIRCYIDAFIEKHPEKILSFNPHDCRRTARTHLGILGIDDVIAEKCLNHATGTQLSRVYDRDEKIPAILHALNILSEFLKACETGAPMKSRDNVIPIHFRIRQLAGN